MKHISSQEKLLTSSKRDFDFYQSLPFAVYVTAKDGIILNFNKEAGDLLSLKPGDKSKANIKDFYSQAKERERLIKRLSGLANGEWERNQTLGFNIKGKRVDLRYFAKTYKDENEVFLGSLCLVFQITAFERFRYLQDDMDIGMFELSADNSLSYSNDKFKEILEIPKNDGKHNFNDFLPRESKSKFSELVDKLKEGKPQKTKLIDLIKTDHTPLVGKLLIVADELDEEKNVIKVKGTLEDGTFSDILDDVPIGLFSLISTVDHSLLISHCNNRFAEIFAQEMKLCIGMEFRKLINNPLDFPDLEYRIKALDATDLISNHMIKCGEGLQKELIVHIKKLENRHRYAGAIYDVTDDVERKLADWKQDFASFLHSFSAMSNSIRETMVSIIETHGTEVVKDSKTDVNQAFQRIHNHINGFKAHYQTFLNVAVARGFDDSKILKHLEKLALLENKDFSKLSLAGIRNIFLRIRKNIDSQQVAVAKETLKGINNEIGEIFRYIKLLNLHYIEQEAYEMVLDIEEFKEVLRSGEYKNSNKEINLLDELRSAANSLSEFAERKNVEIKIKSYSNNILIKCDQRSLYQAFYNVLMNAVKYSWKKPDEKKSWINIDITNQNFFIIIRIENRGVGIHKSEIDSGKIWRFGHRGSQSSDRNRPGTGIGLWHTKKIITRLQGLITITSDPLTFNKPNDFTQPFITKVTITIPESL